MSKQTNNQNPLVAMAWCLLVFYVIWSMMERHHGPVRRDPVAPPAWNQVLPPPVQAGNHDPSSPVNPLDPNEQLRRRYENEQKKWAKGMP